MDGKEFRELLTHMEWADAQTWKAVNATPGAQSDDRLKYLLHHVHLVHAVYLQAWRGDPFQVTELSAYPDLDSVHTWARPFYPSVMAFATTVDETSLGRPIEFPWAGLIAERYGKIEPATLSESAWQVLSHTSYHRGQVAIRVRELGGEPPLVDFLVWVWSGKPNPQWD
jgi:uncharacterized damage-inducible protein DinB